MAERYKVEAELERCLPLALHTTPEGNFRLDIRLRFIEPKSGSVRAEVEFYDPQGKSLRSTDGSSILLSSKDGVEVMTWYLGLLVEKAYERLYATRGAR